LLVLFRNAINKLIKYLNYLLNVFYPLHRNHINRNMTQHSIISEHRIEFSHEFNWGETRILNKEPNYNKRLISEMLHIHKQKQGLNLKTHMDNLDLYLNLFMKLWSFHLHHYIGVEYVYLLFISYPLTLQHRNNVLIKFQQQPITFCNC